MAHPHVDSAVQLDTLPDVPLFNILRRLHSLADLNAILNTCWRFYKYRDEFQFHVLVKTCGSDPTLLFGSPQGDFAVFFWSGFEQTFTPSRFDHLLPLFLKPRLMDIIFSSPLGNSKRTSPAMLTWVARLGTLDMAKQLLASPHFDPAAYDNYALRYTAKQGLSELVKLLLADARVDPAADNNAAIRIASLRGNSQVVKHLLADGRAIPAAIDNSAIRKASQFGQLEVVRLLLADARVDPSACNNFAFRAAMQEGHREVVALLREHMR